MAKKNPRLQFTDAELNPKLRHHARRAGKAADQVERARAKLPSILLAFSEESVHCGGRKAQYIMIDLEAEEKETLFLPFVS